MFTIYQITNTKNGESYIGFTTKTKEIRWRRHQYLARYGSSGKFHSAIREHGPIVFLVETLEEGWDPKIGKDIREPYWISVLKPEYNDTSGGNGAPGHIVSDATRYKMRKPKTLVHREHIRQALIGNKRGLGRKVDEAFKTQQSTKMQGNQYWRNRKTRNKSRESL